MTPTLESRTAAAAIFEKLSQGESWSGEFETQHKDGRRLLVEVTDYPVRGAQRTLTAIVGISRQVGGETHGALVRQASDASALYRLSDRLYRAHALSDVYDAALDAILDTLGCRRASILLFDDLGVLHFVATRGLSENYRKALVGHSPWTPGEREPQPILVSDIDKSDEPEWVKAAIRNEGIRALAFIPLLAQGAVIGKFMTYYEAPHTFAENEVALATAIARQVGFSLERDRAERARQKAESELRESEERFRLMSEHAPVMIWMSDEKGACLHLNQMLRAFWGVDESRLAGFDWRDTMHPDDMQEIIRQISEALARQIRATIKGRYRNARGDIRILQTDARPRFSAEGAFLGMIGVNVDITDRELTEIALRESEKRFRLAVEAAPSGMLMADATGRVVMVNAQAEKLFGYERDELLGRPVESLVPERFRGTHPEYRLGYSDAPAVRAMGAGRDLFALRNDGTEVPVEIGLSPIDTPEGTMALAAIVDITGRKMAEAQRELLVAELNHRVKNILTVVQSIASQTFRRDAPPLEARRAFEGRLHALARAHDLLTTANWEYASLEHLAQETLQALGTDGRRISLSGPSIRLAPRQALAVGLALHELATNALKYGALSNDAGRIEVNWNYLDKSKERFRIVWRERNGPPVTKPTRSGFGSVLLQRVLAGEHDGEASTTFLPEGLVCEISLPLA